MKVQEAIERIEWRKWTASQMVGMGEDGKAFEDLDMAIEALEKQMALKNVIGQIQELANEFQEGFYHEVHCKNREENCEWKDCCACALERAIEIIKEELM